MKESCRWSISFALFCALFCLRDCWKRKHACLRRKFFGKMIDGFFLSQLMIDYRNNLFIMQHWEFICIICHETSIFDFNEIITEWNSSIFKEDKHIISFFAHYYFYISEFYATGSNSSNQKYIKGSIVPENICCQEPRDSCTRGISSARC